MLSRLASRIYWLSRYMERSGNMAKITNAYANLFLDLPVGTEVGWHTLIQINGADKLFSKLYDEKTEDAVMDFLLFNEENYGSIYSSICFARENARTSREILPSETWEIINSLYLVSKKEKSERISKSRRYLYLNNVIHNVMRLEGMLNSGLSRNNTFNFIQIGRNLERADTTTRMLDVGSTLLTEDRSSLLRSHEGVIWMNILRSMNAYQMYRQEVRRRVVGEDVVRFMVHNKHFPRSVAFCISSIREYSMTLPNPDEVISKIELLESELHNYEPEAITAKGISIHMDNIQKLLAELHNSIEDSWFNTNIDL